MTEDCRVYWGSHGCCRPRGHQGPHLCLSCRDDDEDGWVGAPPYYGTETRFYGEDHEAEVSRMRVLEAGVQMMGVRERQRMDARCVLGKCEQGCSTYCKAARERKY